MKTKRLVILTEIISPYRIPLFNALAQRDDLSLHVIFLAETDPALRQWHVYKDEIKFSFEGASFVARSHRKPHCTVQPGSCASPGLGLSRRNSLRRI